MTDQASTGRAPAATATATPTESRYGWLVIAVTTMFQAVSYGIVIYSFTFWVAPWAKDFGTSRAEVLVASTALILAMGFMSPFAGRVLDKRPNRSTVAFGALLLSAGLALISITTQLWQILVIYATVLAAGTVLTGSLPAQTLAAKWFPRNQGLAIGLVTLGTSIGGFLMPPIVTSLMVELGWRGAHLALAAIVLVLIVPPVWFVLKRNPPEQPEARPGPTEGAQAPPQQTAWTTAELLKNRTFWVVVLGFTPLIAAFNSLQFNIAGFAADEGIAAQDAAFLVSILAMSMIGGKIFFGALADRTDHRLLFWISAAAAATSAILFMKVDSYLGLALGSAALGWSGGGLLPLKGAMLAKRFGGRAFGQVMGLVTPFTMLSALVPPVAGWARDASGSFDPVFIAVALLMVPTALVMLALPKR